MVPRTPPPPRKRDESFLEYFSFRATRWVGSIQSLIFHTIIFIISLLLVVFGVSFNTILLTLTTVVSLEAIYLSIFIQMSVNRQAKHLREVSKNVEEIQEDVGEIQEDVEEIQEDVEEIQEDDEDLEKKESTIDQAVLLRIEHSLRELGKEIAEMKRRGGHGKTLLGE